MTPSLKTLLHKYGLLYISITKLSERPGSEFNSLEEYDENLGDLSEGEPAVIVRISESGKHAIHEPGDHDLAVVRQSDGHLISTGLHVMEMPEDQFYFFRAFREGIFDLDRELPAFIYALGQVYAYSLFESYVTEILRDRLHKHPQHIGMKKQVAFGDILAAPCKEALLDSLVDKAIKDLLYLPIRGLFEFLRNRLGFKKLPVDRDERVTEISLLRNCVLHNNGRASAQLVSAFPERFQLDDEITFSKITFSECVFALQAAAVALDKTWEPLGAGTGPR